MRKTVTAKIKMKLLCMLSIAMVLSGVSMVGFAETMVGNPVGNSPVPKEARAEDVSKPDHVIGTGTPESCTAEAFIEAVAQGGKIVFNGGDKPFTITLNHPAKVVNKNPDVVIDGGGVVTLSGGGKTRILYMNTCDADQGWTTNHCQNQERPQLTVQNITFANGNATAEKEYDGGGAIWVRGGRFKVVNCRFTNNVCVGTGPDVGGGAIRVFSQYNNLPVYIVNSTFGGAEGLGNVGSNGGAISSIGVSWTIINSVFSYNEAIGNGGNPKKSGTPGGGSGGAIYNDGNKMTLSISGSRIEYNKVNTHGSGIFFVTNNHTGDIRLDNSVVKNNIGGSWYPVVPEISMHSDTKLTIINTPKDEPTTTHNDTSYSSATPTVSKVVINGKEVAFEAYNIEGNNYFKLRDVAQALKKTEKQFEVGWNESSKVITLTQGRNYSAIGGELTRGASGKTQRCQSVTPAVQLNGKNVEMKAYNINNYNYFKLRDLAQAMDFGVLWDGATNQISIETAKTYRAE